MLLGTYRELDLHRHPAARRDLAEAARAGAVLFHPLAGLDEGDVGAFLERSTTHTPLTRILHAKTGGNPLFLTHLATLLARTPELDDEEAIAKLAEDLPPALRDAIELQLDGLSDACRRVLTIASVAGGEFDLEGVHLASRTSRSELLEFVGEGVRAGLIVQHRADDQTGYRFAHILVRDHLYDSLGAHERATLHLALARGLQNRQTPARQTELATIAHHYRSALPIADVTQAVEFSVRAGTVAQEQSAYEEAAWQYERALAVLDARSLDEGHDRRCAELLLALSAARFRAGDRPGARESCRAAVRLARELEAPDLLARAAFAMSPGFFSIETAFYDDELVTLLEEALAANRNAPPALQARILSRLTTALYWSDESERRATLSRRALRLAEQVGDPSTLAHALHARHSALWGPDDIEARLALAERALRVAGTLSDPEASLLHRAVLITDLAESGAVHLLDREIAKFEAAANELAQPQSMWLGPMFRATRALMEGRFSEAESLGKEFYSIGRRIASSVAESCWAAQTSLARFETGFGRQILPLLRDHIKSHPLLIPFRAAPAWASAELGLVEDARSDFEEFAEQRFANVPKDMNWLGMTTMLAMTCAELRDRPSAVALLDILQPYRSRYGILGYGAVFVGAVSAQLARLAAVSGDWARAEQYFLEGYQLNSRARALPWLARLFYDRGVELMRRGDRKEAARAFREAAHRATALGMSHLSHRVGAALRAVGLSPSETAQS
jgi:tetratricopeptide (TPR) repeat protein